MLTAALLNTHLRDNLNAVRVTYATTLPGSPSDGDIAVLVDSLTLPTYQWKFRYNAGSSNADKWDFLGGAAQQINAATLTVASTTATDYTNGSLTIARAGVYDFLFGSNATNAGSGGKYLDLNISGSVVRTQAVPASANVALSMPTGAWRATGVSASAVAKLQGRGGDATSSTFDKGFLYATPVRVS